MSVDHWFEVFCKNILIDANDIATIRSRYKNITKIINKKYWHIDNDYIKHSLYVGSYGRDTEIFASDIDILIQLPPSIYSKYNSYLGNGQSALLQDVKSTLKQTYYSTDLKGDGQIISLKFSDGINFEVLPAFIRNDNTYLFPNSNNGGSWNITDPKSEIQAINEMNKSSNKNLKRLCRMIRAWKDSNYVDISGILIDTLCYRFISHWKENKESFLYYDWMSRDFFKFLSGVDKDKICWKIMGSNRYIYDYGNFRNKAENAYNLSLQAIDYESKGCDYSAIKTWKEIYGYSFRV